MKKLGFGLMRLPQLDADNYGSVDVERVKKMADLFMEHGFTYFDTAAPYHQGNSEVAFREAVVKRYPRSSYTITDKLSLFMIRDEKEIPGFFEGQMERLGVDYMTTTGCMGWESRHTGRQRQCTLLNLYRRRKRKGR